jgi:hypothetical protein
MNPHSRNFTPCLQPLEFFVGRLDVLAVGVDGSVDPLLVGATDDTRAFAPSPPISCFPAVTAPLSIRATEGGGGMGIAPGEGSGGGGVGDDSAYGEPPKIDIAPSPSWVSA